MARVIALTLACSWVSLMASAFQTPPTGKGKDPFYSPTMKGDKELTDLVKQLKNRDPKARLKAVESIAAKGSEAEPVAAALCDALMDSSPTVTKAALQAVEKVRPDLYKPLTALLVDQNRLNRLEATKELGLMGEKAIPTVNVLLAALRRELAKGPTRGRMTADQEALFTSIRQIKPDDTNTISIYKAIAAPSNKFSAARLQSLDFLYQWAGVEEVRRKEVYPLIKAGLSDSYCQIACIRYLGEYGPLAKECLPALKQLKLSSSEAVREAATESVDKIENQ